MTVIIRDETNTPRTITAIQVRDGTNTPRTISEVRVRDSNNVSRIVFSLTPSMSASASPTTVFGTTLGTGTATTDSTTVTPSGGVAPYNYLWTRTSYDGPVPPGANSPNSATTTFTQTSIGIGTSYSATFRCTVTDDNGSTAHADVSAFWSDTT